MKPVAVLVGSLRKGSINRRYAQALARLGEGKLEFRFPELGDLPMYNDDLWESPPGPVMRLKQEVKEAAAILIVTPEYNRSFPPVIKNAIDWASRPKGDNSWAGKPAALTGATRGAIGTAVAQNSLRHVLSVVGLMVMPLPEVYFTFKDEYFGPDGAVVDESRQVFLQGFVDKFAAWIDRMS